MQRLCTTSQNNGRVHYIMENILFFQYLGMQLNEVLLEFSCFDSFKECLECASNKDAYAEKYANMVFSTHLLYQDLPCEILKIFLILLYLQRYVYFIIYYDTE